MIEFFDIEDWMIIGPMAEDLADDEKKYKKIEKEFDVDDSEEDENYV